MLQFDHFWRENSNSNRNQCTIITKNAFIFGIKIQIHNFDTFLKIEFLDKIWDFLTVWIFNVDPAKLDIPWMTCRLTKAGSKLAGRHVYFPECAGVGFRIVTVEMALPSATSRWVKILIPPRKNNWSKSNSGACVIAEIFRRFLPRVLICDVGLGVVGLMRSPGIWSSSSRSLRSPWYQNT